MIGKAQGDRLRAGGSRLGVNIYLCVLSFPICALCLGFLFTFSCQIKAEDIPSRETEELNARLKFSFGYDNNVSDAVENKIKSRFAQLYINSNFNTSLSKQTLLSLKLQDGFRYLDAESLSHESVLINDLSLHLTHRLSDKFVPGIFGEIRDRTSIHGKSDVTPSEEAYLRGLAGLALKFAIHGDLVGRVFYKYMATNFEDFDPFDRRGPELGLKADIRLLPGSIVSIGCSQERMHFNKWDEGKTTREDVTFDYSLSTQIYKNYLLDITFSYQDNRSDIQEYSYTGKRLALLLAKSLPEDYTVQSYLLVQFRKYRTPSGEPTSIQIDVEDDERGMFLIKISKDINERVTLEAQYDLRRNRSRKEDGLYTKSVFSTSLSFNF